MTSRLQQTVEVASRLSAGPAPSPTAMKRASAVVRERDESPRRYEERSIGQQARAAAKVRRCTCPSDTISQAEWGLHGCLEHDDPRVGARALVARLAPPMPRGAR